MFEITYDTDGKPVRVCTDDGFMQTSRPFDPAEDGWMLDQLDPRGFPEIRTGQRVAALVAEVNALRRENWRQAKELKQLREVVWPRH